MEPISQKWFFYALYLSNAPLIIYQGRGQCCRGLNLLSLVLKVGVLPLAPQCCYSMTSVRCAFLYLTHIDHKKPWPFMDLRPDRKVTQTKKKDGNIRAREEEKHKLFYLYRGLLGSSKSHSCATTGKGAGQRPTEKMEQWDWALYVKRCDISSVKRCDALNVC